MLFLTPSPEQIGAAPADLSGTAQQLALGLATHTPQDALVALANSGTAITIGLYGDSTTVGTLDQGIGTTSPTPAAMLQAILREYYSSSVTVTGYGVQGDQTTNALERWSARMATDTASSIAYLNFGMNDSLATIPSGEVAPADPAIDADQYGVNMRELVRLTRAAGKAVVLETPNPAFYAGGAYQSYARSEAVRQYAQVTRQVAKELNAPLVDTHAFVEQWLTQARSVAASSPDNVHSAKVLYDAITRLRADVLLPALRIAAPGYMPVGLPHFRHSGGLSLGLTASAVPSGSSRVAAKITVPVKVDAPGLDLYVSTSHYDAAPATETLRIDAADVVSWTRKNTAIPSAGAYAVGSDTLIMQDAEIGLHMIQLTTASGNVDMQYLRAVRTRRRSQWLANSTATAANAAPTSEIPLLRWTTTASGNNHLLTDVPTSRSIAGYEVEFDALLATSTGIGLATVRRNNGAAFLAGILVYLNASGYATITEGVDFSTAYSGTALDAVDHSGAFHRYRITVTTGGLVTLYIDGSSVGTFTQTAGKPFIGGNLSLWGLDSGKAIEVRGLTISQ